LVIGFVILGQKMMKMKICVLLIEVQFKRRRKNRMLKK